MNLGRKIKRQKNREDKKVEKKIKDKLMMFDNLPEECLTCEREFDRQNKEMVATWNVVVREKEGIVRLYCPDCWSKAIEVTKHFMGEGSEESS
jgi:predicted RNA-binding Zn-ribbon protein involved in translation (DUF1610 family)